MNKQANNPFGFANRCLLLRLLLVALLPLAIAGCAADRVFENCNVLVDRENAEEALLLVQRHLRQGQQTVGCQRAENLLQDRMISGLLKQAEQNRREGRWDVSTTLYQKALSIQPMRIDVRQGLTMSEHFMKIQNLLVEAKALIQRNDLELARLRLESLLQLDSQHIEAKRILADLAVQSDVGNVDSGLAANFKKPISIEFREAPLKTVFEFMSRSSGLNFVFDKDVKTDQKTSIFLKDSTVESAIHYLLLSNQLEQQVMSANTVLIYPNVPTKLKEYQELSVKAFRLTNADAKTVAAALKLPFKGRDIVVDEKLNMLTVRDTPEAIRAVGKMIALHDVAEPEVMLEVEILEVSRDRLLNLGVELPGSLSLKPLASGANLTLNDLRGANGSSIGATVGALTINAQKTDKDINILANPRIRVVNREKAKVQIGEKVPIISAVSTANTAVATESITYVDVGLKLDVEPMIYRGGDIVLKIGLEVSNISGATESKLGSVAYSFGTRIATTTLRLKDGENQILAGLINDEDRKTGNKFPGLGDMPVIGKLFGSQQDTGKKTEIVLSITPRLTRRADLSDGMLPEFRSGTESSMRERPMPISMGSKLPSAVLTSPAQAAAQQKSGASMQVDSETAPVTAPLVRLPSLAGPVTTVVQTEPSPLQALDPSVNDSSARRNEKELAELAISALKGLNGSKPGTPSELPAEPTSIRKKNSKQRANP